MNKKQELAFSSQFVDYINRENSWNYKAVPNLEEASSDSEVDVYAKSETLRPLKIQVKIIDKGYMPGVISRAKEADQNPSGVSAIHVRDLEPVKWAKQAISECSNKYEPNVRKGLVLLMCVYYGGEVNQEYLSREFEEFQRSDFLGIYLIDPPRSLANSNREYAGQVTAIKPLTA